MIRTSRTGHGTSTCGEIRYEKPSVPVSKEKDIYIMSKAELIIYAESIGVDVPEKITVEHLRILIENKKEESGKETEEKPEEKPEEDSPENTEE